MATETNSNSKVTPAPKKVPSTKAKAAKAKKLAKGLGRFPNDAVIQILVDNPRREGTAAYGRFAALKNGMTVGKFITSGVAGGSVAKAVKRGWIKVEEPKAK